MKKGKSVKLSGYRNYKVNYGTVDAKLLKSIYLNIQTWVEPKKELLNPIKSVNNLTRQIKNSLHSILNKDLFNEQFIIDLDLRSSGIHAGKKSFLNLECYFYIKKSDLDFKSLEIRNEMKNLTDNLIKLNFKKNEIFLFSISKKEPILVK